MKVTKSQIVDGLAAYIREELLPKMGQTKGLQVMLNVAINAVKANDQLLAAVFGNQYIRALIQDDGAGNYEIGELMNNLRASVEEFGGLPITVPSIPLILPTGSTITLFAADVDAIRRRIEGTGGGGTIA